MKPEVSKSNLSNLYLRASETDVIDEWLKENMKVWHEYDECHWKVKGGSHRIRQGLKHE
jgi:hypothetical protein